MAEPVEPDELLERASEYAQVADEDEEREIALALTEARALVTRHCGSQYDTVPAAIADRAIVEVATELFQRKNARNGVLDLGSTEIAPHRVRNDPMKGIYSLLTPYIGLGIG